MYRFYVSPDGQPLRLHMHGNDIFSGAHFDKWIADYSYYTPTVNTAAFTAPDICRNTSLTATKSRFRSFPMQMKAHLPYVLFRRPHSAQPGHVSCCDLAELSSRGPHPQFCAKYSQSLVAPACNKCWQC